MKKRLGDYIQECSVRNRSGEDIPVYSVTNSQGFCRDYFSKEVASKDKTTYKIVPRGCFAYNPSRINVGSVDWQRDEERVIVSPLYNVFSVSPEIDQQYLYYYLKSNATLYRIKEVATGSVRDNLRLSMLYDFMIELPNLDIQRQIVSNLDLLASIIRQRKQQLTKLDELVKARFVEMFGNAETTSQAQTKRLEECCISISGGNTPSMQHPEYYGGKIPFIKSGDVKSDHISVSSLTLTQIALNETTVKMLPKGTLIVVIRSAALLKEFRIGILDVDAVINQDLKALQTSDDVLPVYLMWAIKMKSQVLLSRVQTMLTSHIRMEDLLDLKVQIPPLSLQNQFAAFVEEVDKSKLLATLFAQNACVLAENRSK